MIRLILASSCAILLSIEVANADELNPAYLQIQQLTESEWSVYWKVSHPSSLSSQPLLEFGEACSRSTESDVIFSKGRRLEQFTIHCQDRYSSFSVSIPSLQQTNTDVLVRLIPLDAAPQHARLVAKKTNAVFHDDVEASSNVFAQYTYIGFEHIVFGWDHLLFVIGMVLLVRKLSLLFWTITAFTLSHSITLIASTMGFLGISQAFVEAMIALSIVVLAREVVFEEQNSFTKRLPWLVALFFGLLHGFGFAGALNEIGLPQNAIPAALFSFNLGVELGQLFVVLIFSGLLWFASTLSDVIESRFRLVSAYLLGIVASVWLLQRIII